MNEAYQISTAGGGDEEPVLQSEGMSAAGMISTQVVPSDSSPDDERIIFSTLDLSARRHLWVLPLTGDRKPFRFFDSSSDEMQGNFSPDGRFVAYSSNESGRFEFYVQTFPRSERKWTVSANGGYEPRWRGDGREIYYLSEDRKLMAVSVGTGPSFEVPKALFQTRVPVAIDLLRTRYVPSRDGQRFLINTQIGDPAPTPITVVLNWTEWLKK